MTMRERVVALIGELQMNSLELQTLLEIANKQVEELTHKKLEVIDGGKNETKNSSN